MLPTDSSSDSLREELAAIQHSIWAHWMNYMFSVSRKNRNGSVTIPADKVRRWVEQMEKPYGELTESEKVSDREQADKIFAVLGSERAA
jgi:hypothetical protein